MKKTLAFAAIAAVSASPAFAHHPLGGMMPETLAHGFLSGVGHPILGFDHLAFVLAMGVAAVFTGRAMIAPLAYIAAMVGGVALMLSGAALPYAELAIAGSVAILGALILSGVSLSVGAAAALFAVAGLFHGWGLGASIVGAETGVIGAYLAGLSLTQYALAVGAGLLVSRFWKASAADLAPRLTGAVLAGVGAAILLENAEALLF